MAETEDMGNIIVTGDIVTTDASTLHRILGAEPKQTAPQAAPQAQPSSTPGADSAPVVAPSATAAPSRPWWRSPAALITAGALLGGGAGVGIPAAVSALSSSPPAQTGTAPGSDSWMEYTIEKIPADQLPGATPGAADALP